MGSSVSLGADVLWCTGGNEVLCKRLGTSSSGIAIGSLRFIVTAVEADSVVHV